MLQKDIFRRLIKIDMKQQVRQRQSNIELLRIIAMLMIVSAHLGAHGVEHMGREDAYITWDVGNIVNKIFICFLIGGGVSEWLFSLLLAAIFAFSIAK